MTSISKKRKYIYIALTIAWMTFIFVHSAMPADVSQIESGWLSGLVSRLFHLDPDTGSFIVRKCAHFFEYIVLGIFVSLSTGAFSGRTLIVGLISWGIGVLYAVTDEVHQLFVEGRSCELRDMAIDACGVLLGVIICMGVRWIRKKRISRRRNDRP